MKSVPKLLKVYAPCVPRMHVTLNEEESLKPTTGAGII